MKNLFTLLLTISLVPFLATAQNVGVDVATPVQKLDVAGGIKIGNTANGVAGSLRWDGTNIQYHDGTSWINLVANSDDQTLSIALNILSIEDGNTVDLTPYLDNTDAQTLSLAGTTLTISTGNNVDLSPLQAQLVDADNDTKVQVEESADEDIIRFDLAGNERWLMTGSRIENAGTGNSVFIGENAGQNDDLGNRNNTAVGSGALSTNVSGIENTAVGNSALSSSTGSRNTALGAGTIQAAGAGNVAVGWRAGSANNGDGNVFVGEGAGRNHSSGDNNVMIGSYAGFDPLPSTGSGNILIGNNAGSSQSPNNELYIDNSNTATPLIYGDFATNELRFNGSVNIGGNYTLPTADGTSGYVLSTDGAGTASWVNPGLTGDITAVIAGDGLANGGTSGDVTLDVNPGLGIELVSDEVRADVDDSTIDFTGNELRVKPSGITATEIATGGVTSIDILDGTVSSLDILDATIVAGDIANAGNDQVLITDGSGVAQWQDQTTLFGGQAGDGLVNDIVNSEMDVNPGDGIAVNADQVEVVSTDISGAGLTVTSNDLDVNVDDSSIEVNGITNEVQVKADGIVTGHIAPETILAGDIATGAVETSEILNGTILGEDIDPSATVNQVLATTVANTTVAWVDPATLTTTLQDNDADTKIEVEASADEDFIRMSTAGAEELTINPAGNVGFGIADPARPVHVAGASGGQILVSRDDATVTTGETLGEILFDAEDDNASTVDASAVVRAISAEPTSYGNSDKGGHLTFLTKANATDENAAATEHMRITQDGKIAVGTTTANAGAKMTVSNGDDSYTHYGPNTSWGGRLYVGAGTNTVSAATAQVISTNGNLHLDPGVGNHTYVNYYQGGHTFLNAGTGNVGVGTTNPTFKLHVPSGYIGTDYLNTTDNSVGSGVTGIMIKAGDNYHRTGTASAVATFLNTTGTWIPNNGSGNYQIASNSNSTSYTAASLELRETNFAGAGQQPPRLSFHWGGVVASQLSVESSGRIVVRNNPGNGYESFGANNITAHGHFYGRAVNGQYSNIYRMGGLYFTWDSDSYGTNTHHSIRSTYGNSYGDNITLNSFNHIRFNVDANNNNGVSYFEVGDNTTGTGNIMFRLQTGGDMTLNGKLAIRSNDSWLRLNQNNNFGSGTYTPGHLRTDGGFTSGASGNPGAGNIRATGLAGGGNTVVLADNNGTLYDVANLNGTGLGDNLGNHTAATTLNMNNNNIMIKPNVTANTSNHGIGWHGTDGAYKIYQEAGNWSYPYPDLMIRFHTGIKLSAHGDYGGVRIFANNGESETARFNNSGMTMFRDINLQGNDVWAVNDLTVQTIYDNGGDVVHFDQQNSNRMRWRFDVGASRDVWFDEYNNSHPMIRSGVANTGFIGKFNNYWLYVYKRYDARLAEIGFSDKRLKKNIREIEQTSSLDKLMQLDGKMFDLAENHPYMQGAKMESELDVATSTNVMGFLAQDLQEVLPEMVVEDENTGYLMVVDYEQMFPVVVEAMKEQQKQIEELKEMVKQLLESK